MPPFSDPKMNQTEKEIAETLLQAIKTATETDRHQAIHNYEAFIIAASMRAQNL
jgi:menaquinone-dependent protoporphyrinogen IX oxidase